VSYITSDGNSRRKGKNNRRRNRNRNNRQNQGSDECGCMASESPTVAISEGDEMTKEDKEFEDLLARMASVERSSFLLKPNLTNEWI
jgi:hypothetical protein